jgi:transcriptional regulator with XRE-family HTH domain
MNNQFPKPNTLQLRKQKAMSRSQVAKTLGITPREVDKLRKDGKLIPDGKIAIQWSRGKECYVWLPATITAYAHQRNKQLGEAKHE